MTGVSELEILWRIMQNPGLLHLLSIMRNKYAKFPLNRHCGYRDRWVSGHLQIKPYLDTQTWNILCTSKWVTLHLKTRQVVSRMVLVVVVLYGAIGAWSSWWWRGCKRVFGLGHQNFLWQPPPLDMLGSHKTIKSGSKMSYGLRLIVLCANK